MTVHVRHETSGETIGFRAADFGSLDALLHHCLTMIGRTPRVLVAGVAGQPRPNGDVRVTNRPDWPVFRRDRFAATYGIQVETVNDMEAIVAGVGDLDETGYQLLTSTGGTPPGAAEGRGLGAAAVMGTGGVAGAIPATGGGAAAVPGMGGAAAVPGMGGAAGVPGMGGSAGTIPGTSGGAAAIPGTDDAIQGMGGGAEEAPGAGPGGRARLVVAVDSGVGVGYLDAHGRPHGTEGGHIPWQPRTRREGDYLAWLRAHWPAPRVPVQAPGPAPHTSAPAATPAAAPARTPAAVSVEESISGARGFAHLYDFVALNIEPAPLLAAGVERARSERLGIAPLVIAGALAGDEFCVEVMRLFGGILGQFLRSMALVTLGRGGSVWLCGSVLRSPGVTDFLMADGCLMAAFRPAGAEHANLMDEIPVHLVHDREIGVRGALVLGRSRFQSAGQH
ncbi:glucokinase, partial [Nonomuraea sp. RK-328]|nr:glucokinase [Nonomuraea sp. RK-328]